MSWLSISPQIRMADLLALALLFGVGAPLFGFQAAVQSGGQPAGPAGQSDQPAQMPGQAGELSGQTARPAGQTPRAAGETARQGEQTKQTVTTAAPPLQASPSQPAPCAVNEPRPFWQHFQCGEPAAYSAVGAMVAGLFTIFLTLVAIKINLNTVRGQRVHEQVRMVLEIDKELIANPQLWGVYNGVTVTLPENETEDSFEKRKEAFVYSYLNMFDLVYGFYSRKIWMRLRPFSRDRQDWKAWQAYVKSFLRDSDYARGVWAKADQAIYPKSFAKFINKAIAGINGATTLVSTTIIAPKAPAPGAKTPAPAPEALTAEAPKPEAPKARA